MARAKKPDFTIMNHGTVVMVKPQTKAAKGWVAENLSVEGWQYLGAAFAVDPRYLDNLIAGMEGDGLVVN